MEREILCLKGEYTCMLPTSSIGCLRLPDMSATLRKLGSEGEDPRDFILSLSGLLDLEYVWCSDSPSFLAKAALRLAI